MNLIIRKARREDLTDILSLFDTQESGRWDKAQAKEHYTAFFREADSTDHQVFVGALEERIVSVIGYVRDDETIGIYWLDWFYTHKRFSGQGYGSQMLDYVTEELKTKEPRKLFAYTSSSILYERAQRLYRRKGFQVEGTLKDFYWDGEDRIILGKYL